MKRFASFLFVLIAAGIAQNPQWKIYKPTNTGVQGDYSFGVAVDKSGRVWANGHDPVWDEGGAVMYDGRVWHNWSTVDSAVPVEELTSFNVDSSGNVWCASTAGLSKFDGRSWTTYNRGNQPGFPCDAVTDIDVDSAGSVWFALSSVDSNAGGVGRFDGHSFKFWNSYTGLPWPGHTEYVLSIGCGPGGVVYAGAAGVGVARYESGIWTYLSDSVTGDVDAIVVDSSGIAWFAMQVLLSYDHGVWRDHGFTGSLPILGLAFRKAGGVWVGAPNGLFSYNNNNWSSMNWPGSFCYAAAESPDGSVWAGGIGGIAHYSGGRWVLYNTQNVGLSNRWVNGIDFDSNHNIWVSTSGGGIDRFDGETWMGFNPYNGGMFPWPYPTDAVQASVEGADGNIWAATYGQGIAVWDGSNWIRRYMETWVIDNIVRDSTGGLWCMASSGLYHFEGDTWRRFDFLNSPLPSYVTGVCADVGGYVWVTNLGGLFRTDGVHWEFWTPESAGMPGTGNCTSPARAPDGTLWLEAAVGTGNPRSALLHLRPEDSTWTVYDSTNSPLEDCGVVAVTGQNVVWVGYSRDTYPPRGGVARFDGSNWTLYDRDNSPLPGEAIYDISIDWNDNPWISCASEGIAVIYDNPVAFEENPKSQTPNPKLVAVPNPFRERVTIRFGMPLGSRTKVTVVDVAGRLVRSLGAGPNASSTVWDGRNESGTRVRAGVYFVRFDSPYSHTAARVLMID